MFHWHSLILIIQCGILAPVSKSRGRGERVAKMRDMILSAIEAIKQERGGKFYSGPNCLPFTPKFNGKYLDDVDYKSLNDKQLFVFYRAITEGVSNANRYV